MLVPWLDTVISISVTGESLACYTEALPRQIHVDTQNSVKFIMKTKTETKKNQKDKKYCSMFMGWGRRFVQ